MYESIDASSSIPLDRFSTRFSGEGGGGGGKFYLEERREHARVVDTDGITGREEWRLRCCKVESLKIPLKIRFLTAHEEIERKQRLFAKIRENFSESVIITWIRGRTVYETRNVNPSEEKEGVGGEGRIDGEISKFQGSSTVETRAAFIWLTAACLSLGIAIRVPLYLNSSKCRRSI